MGSSAPHLNHCLLVGEKLRNMKWLVGEEAQRACSAPGFMLVGQPMHSGQVLLLVLHTACGLVGERIEAQWAGSAPHLMHCWLVGQNMGSGLPLLLVLCKVSWSAGGTEKA